VNLIRIPTEMKTVDFLNVILVYIQCYYDIFHNLLKAVHI